MNKAEQELLNTLRDRVNYFADKSKTQSEKIGKLESSNSQFLTDRDRARSEAKEWERQLSEARGWIKCKMNEQPNNWDKEPRPVDHDEYPWS